MKVKLLLFVLLFSVLNLCLKAQVRLVPADSVLMVDSVNDKMVRICLIIDRSNDTIFKDSTLIFYISEYPSRYSFDRINKGQWVYAPFSLWAGSGEYYQYTGPFHSISYSRTIEDVAKREHRRLWFRFGKTAVDRVEIKPKEKALIEFTLSVKILMSYYDSFLTDPYHRYGMGDFSLSIGYGINTDFNPYHIALKKYDTNLRKKRIVFEGSMESAVIKVVFK